MDRGGFVEGDLKKRRLGSRRKRTGRSTRAPAHKVVILSNSRRTATSWKAEIFAVGPERNPTIFGLGHNDANEPCPWFRRFSSREITCGSPDTSIPPESRPASLCHYYRGTFHCVSVDRRREDTFNFTDPTSLASKGSRRATGPVSNADDPLDG